MSERKMATIQTIKEIKPIKDADAIEACRINGWWVVSKKDEFKVGDKVQYFELDAWIPNSLAPFLSKGKEPREYNGVLGERLRSVRLRGQLSQGLILPIKLLEDMVEEYLDGGFVRIGDHKIRLFEDGTDISEILNIQKYEPPVPANLAGQVVGGFPTTYLPKTDQERVQNYYEEIFFKDTFEVSMKLDGSSCSIMKIDGKLRVCSRNLELKINEENANNTLVKLALELEDKLADIDNIALQGEAMGEGIQGNKEKLKGHHFFVFDMYDIENKMYFTSKERLEFCKDRGIEHTPIICEDLSIDGMTVDEILEMADGPSITAKYREGLVFKSKQNPDHSFKAISNKWLLKNGE